MHRAHVRLVEDHHVVRAGQRRRPARRARPPGCSGRPGPLQRPDRGVRVDRDHQHVRQRLRPLQVAHVPDVQQIERRRWPAPPSPPPRAARAPAAADASSGWRASQPCSPARRAPPQLWPGHRGRALLLHHQRAGHVGEPRSVASDAARRERQGEGGDHRVACAGDVHRRSRPRGRGSARPRRAALEQRHAVAAPGSPAARGSRAASTRPLPASSSSSPCAPGGR